MKTFPNCSVRTRKLLLRAPAFQKDSDISAYTYERTVQMQNRSQFLASLNLRTVDRNRNPQAVVDSLQMEMQNAEGRPTATSANGGGRRSSGEAPADALKAVDEAPQPPSGALSGSNSDSEEDLLTPQTEVSQYTFSPVMLNQANAMSKILGSGNVAADEKSTPQVLRPEKGGDHM